MLLPCAFDTELLHRLSRVQPLNAQPLLYKRERGLLTLQVLPSWGQSHLSLGLVSPS